MWVNLVYEDMRMSLSSGEILPREEIATMLDAQLRDETPVASRVMPEYVDLQCDGRGRAWIQPLYTTEGALGRGATWLRTSGTATADQPGYTRVRFAEGFTPLDFEADRVWGFVLDDLDVPTLAWTGLP